MNTLQKPPRPSTPRSTKSARRRDIVASAAALAPFARACAGVSSGWSRSRRKGLRRHGGDCAARGRGARPPVGARGAGTRNTASSPPPLFSPRVFPPFSGRPCDDPPQFAGCDPSPIPAGCDPSCESCDSCDVSNPNLGRLLRMGERCTGDLGPLFSFSLGS